MDYYALFYSDRLDEFYKFFFSSEEELLTPEFFDDLYEVALGFFDNLRDWRIMQIEVIK